MRVKILNWNVHSLNNKDKRSTLKSLIQKWGADIVCLLETKIESWNPSLIRQIWGNNWLFWAEVKAIGTKGGLLILWDKRALNSVESEVGAFSLSRRFESTSENFNWVFTRVYGPHTNPEREDLWLELASIRGLWSDLWVIGGDFNVCRFEGEG